MEDMDGIAEEALPPHYHALKRSVPLQRWADPDEMATFAVDPGSGAKSFFTNYNNPTVVKAVHDAEKTLSTSGRQDLYNTIQSDAASDAFMPKHS